MRIFYPLFFIVFLFVNSAAGRQIHVSKSGNDNNYGNSDSPLLTINKAAQAAQPGDVVIVHAGVYRERINPLHSGLSDSNRIIYQAATGEQVSIKGSERITNWVSKGSGTWYCDIDDAYFGLFNPFTKVLTGGFLYGGWQHLGNVYINDQALIEVNTPSAVGTNVNAWYTSHSSTTTTITANFGSRNPNNDLTEINVRQTIFYPSAAGINYINVNGFILSQAATRWQSPQEGEQDGIIGSNGGHHWIIQDCRISYARCTGISLGIPTSGYVSRSMNYATTGHHVIQNNTIIKCGEAGVCGAGSFATASKIYNNLIDSINYTNEFGGYEVSGLKFHGSVDMELKNNIVRNIGPSVLLPYGTGWGIWMDYCNQGTRISGNIIYGCYNEAILLECNLGPILLDNNICIGNVESYGSQGQFFVHNLFINTSLKAISDNSRLVWYYAPHTITANGIGVPAAGKTLAPGTIPAIVTENKFYNNIFIGSGFTSFGPTPGSLSDKNIFYQDAVRSSWGDINSISDRFNTNYSFLPGTNSVTINFSVNSSVFALVHPLITYDFIGIGALSYPKQGIENPDGTHITISADINSVSRSLTKPMPGPFEDMRMGINSYTFKAGVTDTLLSNFPVTIPQILPIKISDFKCTVHQCRVLLEWVSNSNASFDHFEIEKSIDGNKFSLLRSVASKCNLTVDNCSYSAEIDQMDMPRAFYRIKIVYKDGSFEYTNIDTADVNCIKKVLQVYPNPAGNQVNVVYRNVTVPQFSEIRITDISGRVVYKKTVSLTSGTNYFPIDISTLIAGNYVVSFESESVIITKKFL